MAVDQHVMDQLIAASIHPATLIAPSSSSKTIAKIACEIAEAVYEQREKCINERAEVEAAEKSKRQEKVRTSKVITMKPEDMSGGMP